MPFQSKSQQRFMFSQHPEIAKRWAAETPDIKNLPNKKKKRKTGNYDSKDVNRAREMVGEGKASNAARPYARGGQY